MDIMEEKSEFLLVSYVFGERAGVQSGQEEQWKAWAHAFEGWLEERERRFSFKERCTDAATWRDFLAFKPKPPWELTAQDIQDWISYEARRGMKPNYVNRRLWALSAFFDYCAAQGLESAGQPAGERVGVRGRQGFNPVRGVARPNTARLRTRPACLSRGAALALLAAIDCHESLLGKRDYALILLHLLCGRESNELRELTWGELERGAVGQPGNEEVWVRWRRAAGGEQSRLPMQAWQAILDYLRATGRLDGMQAGDYIFAPLREKFARPQGRAGDWNASRPLSLSQGLALLRQYAAWAGLPAQEITFRTLRHTAALLEAEWGEDEAGPESFVEQAGRQSRRRFVERLAQAAIPPPALQVEEPYPRGSFQARPGEQRYLTHGLYAAHLPETELEGTPCKEPNLDREIARLRAVMERALALALERDSPEYSLKLLEVYSQAATRLASLLKAERQLKQDGVVPLLEEAIRQAAEEMGLT
jgi:integrase